MTTENGFVCKACQGEKEPRIHVAKGLCWKCYKCRSNKRYYKRMVETETKAHRKERLRRKAQLMARYRRKRAKDGD